MENHTCDICGDRIIFSPIPEIIFGQQNSTKYDKKRVEMCRPCFKFIEGFVTYMKTFHFDNKR